MQSVAIMINETSISIQAELALQGYNTQSGLDEQSKIPLYKHWIVCPKTGLKVCYMDELAQGDNITAMPNCHPMFADNNALVKLRYRINHERVEVRKEVDPRLIAGSILYHLTTKDKSGNTGLTHANLRDLMLANEALACLPHVTLEQLHTKALRMDTTNRKCSLAELVAECANIPEHIGIRYVNKRHMLPLANKICQFIVSGNEWAMAAIEAEVDKRHTDNLNRAAIDLENLLQREANKIDASTAIANIIPWLNYIKPAFCKDKDWAKLNANLAFSVSIWSMDTLAETINFLNAKKREADKGGIGKSGSTWHSVQSKARYIRILDLISAHYQDKLDQQVATENYATLAEVSVGAVVKKASKQARKHATSIFTGMSEELIASLDDPDSEF
jgi:hypothetical protein